MKYNNKNMNNVRGFTLIELLAVIVVLAIIMLLAVNAIFPQMDKARTQAFAIEANGLIKSATQYAITKSYEANKVVDKNGVCVTVDALVNSGDSDLDKSKYHGYVIIKKAGNINTYQVWLANGSFMVIGEGITGTGDTATNVSVEAGDVKKYDSAQATTFAACPKDTNGNAIYENWG